MHYAKQLGWFELVWLWLWLRWKLTRRPAQPAVRMLPEREELQGFA